MHYASSRGWNGPRRPCAPPLNAVATAAPDWLQERVPLEWYDRYGRRIEDYRLPKGLSAQHAYAVQVGNDGGRLLTMLAHPETPEGVRSLPAVRLLRQFWEQEYMVDAAGQYAVRDPKAAAAASEHLESPYEPEARFATKRGRHWTGYKVHVTEVCDDDAPHLLIQVATTIAPATDVRQLPLIQDALAQRGLLPAQQLVDAGYVRAGNVVQSREQHQIEVVGPVDADHQWQARVTGGYVTERFQIDWEHQHATCPRGRRSIRWCETHTARKRTMIHIDFDPADCLPCPDRALCTRSQTGSRARCMTVQSRAEYEALLAGRARQQTPEFIQIYARRAGIEGTVSQAVRAFGLRHARYRGLQQTHLQHMATAVAIDLTRLTQWLNRTPTATTRRSRFARLAPAS